MTTRRKLLIAFGASALAAPLAAFAQQQPKIPRIGILRSGSPPDPLVEAFVKALRELGYEDGRNIVIDYRWAEGKEDRFADLATVLVVAKADVIVVSGPAAVRATMRATSAIPIVMPVGPDPVEAGLVASLARPGGNVTGIASQPDELAGKWLELLRETVPKLSRVGALWNPANGEGMLKASELAARALGLQLQTLKVERPADYPSAFAEARKRRAQAVIVLASPLHYANRTRIIELAAKHRLPTIYDQRDFVVGSGGLMSYGADFFALFRRAAIYVDKILKGAKPADLPVELPTKFELVINMKTARALGITIPQSVLLRAERVIE